MNIIKMKCVVELNWLVGVFGVNWNWREEACEIRSLSRNFGGNWIRNVKDHKKMRMEGILEKKVISDCLTNTSLRGWDGNEAGNDLQNKFGILGILLTTMN